ncbi:MAG TPA: tRNA glutamyl-Q(34) synthetase GluQRS [Ilumatobacteraceae bacterium]|jgi:glutamyl-tRNA synthetase
MDVARGRFAPSPTGSLHLGNLRTALIAWLVARSAPGEFIVRMEDLDRVTASRAHEQGQLSDLTRIGIDWDGEVVRQSERFDRYYAAIELLRTRGVVYECYCTRREVRLAAEAPNGPDTDGRYPETCRDLSESRLRQHRDAGRRPALRLRSDGHEETFDDLFLGPQRGPVDDFVIQRNDGVPAYNLAVVVDDAAQGVTEVVRGDDLVASTPRQIALHRLLELRVPTYAHIPLVLAPDGSRLAKRHGAVTLADLGARGQTVSDVIGRLAASIGIDAGDHPVAARDLLDRFDLDRVPGSPWVLRDDEL